MKRSVRMKRDFLSRLDFSSKMSLISMGSTPSEDVEVFVDDRDVRVRVAVSLRTDLTSEAYVKLSKDKSLVVVKNVARNLSPNITYEAWRNIDAKDDPVICKYLSANKNVPGSILRRIYVKYGYYEAFQQLSSKMFVHGSFNDEFSELYKLFPDMTLSIRELFLQHLEKWFDSFSVLKPKSEDISFFDVCEDDWGYASVLYRYFTGHSSEGIPEQWIEKVVRQYVLSPIPYSELEESRADEGKS